MKYLDAITDFFKSPKWVPNLLFAALCVLSSAIIPLVGIIVLMGWLVTGFWMRQSEDFTTFPDFDFAQLTKYLERGLWPVLTTALAIFGVAIVAGLVLFVPLAILGALAANENGVVGGFFGFVISVLSLGVYTVLYALVTLAMVPVGLRATLTQDFVAAFDLPFIKKFSFMMWKEVLLAALFMGIASGVLWFAGMLALCVGVFAAMAIVYFAWTHLSWQLYKLYLSRGGDPVPVSPKLTAPAV